MFGKTYNLFLNPLSKFSLQFFFFFTSGISIWFFLKHQSLLVVFGNTLFSGLLSFLFVFLFLFIYPHLSPPSPPQFQAGPFLHLSLVLLKKRDKPNKEDKVFLLAELRIAIQKES
jgi:hypothetical protein